MTPDYYPVLRKAAAGLGRSDKAVRYALYQRAMRALVSQLRNADPPLPDSEIDAHVEALWAAVERIEKELDDERSQQLTPQDIAPARDKPSADTAPATRRRYGIAAAGALALITIAGLGTYFALSRNRGDPVSAGRKEAAPLAAVALAPKGPPADPAHASYILRQQRVYYRTTQPVGTVIVSRNQRFLYLVQPNQVAIRYAIAVGPQCDHIGGLFRVTDKVKETKPDEIDTGARPGVTAQRKAGGAQFDRPALYFGGVHAVHKASEPGRVGESAAAGCFQAWDRDMGDLYERVPIDERVVVAN